MSQAKSDYSRVVIYHGGCYDGSAAAWCFHKKFGSEDTAYHPTNVREFEKDTKMPELRDKEVWILDFCYDAETLRRIKAIAKSLCVIDHHKTALPSFAEEDVCDNLIDLTHCASILTYRHLFGVTVDDTDIYGDVEFKTAESVPWWMEHIEDRDLWRWTHPRSKDFGAHLHHLALKESHRQPYNAFAVLDALETFTDAEKERFYDKGAMILELQDDEIAGICKYARLARFEEYTVYVTDNPKFRSEVGNILAKKEECDFAFICRYNMQKREWWVSLRGDKEKNIDLTVVAGRFDGGGHPSAAGFKYSGSIHDILYFIES